MGVTGKNYESHVNRSRGWTNECIGYHINGNIFDAFTANSIIEIEGAQDKYVLHTNCIEFNICKASCASYHQFRLSSLFCSFILQTKGIKDIFRVNTFEIAIFVFDYQNYLFLTLLLIVLVTNSQSHFYGTRTVSNYQTHVCRTNLKQFTISTKAELCKNSAVLRTFTTFLKYAAYLTFHSLWIVCKSNLNP